MRYVLLLTLLAARSPLHAQSELRVIPDSIYTDNHSYVEVAVANDGAPSLTLERLSIRTDGGFGGAWRMRFLHRGTLYEIATAGDSVFVSTPPLPFDAGEEAVLTIEYYDPCPICRGNWGIDTLYFHTDEPVQQPSARLLMNRSDIVANEDPASGSSVGLRLGSLVPNPIGGIASVTLRATRPGPVGLDVLDSRGRRVRVIWRGAVTAGERVVALNLSGLPPGVYFLRATMDGQPPSFQSFVVPF